MITLKKRIASIVTIMTLLVAFYPAVALAVDGQTTEIEQTTSTTEKTPQTTDPNTELQARLEKRKAELKIKLSSAQKTRIKVKCKASQGIIGNIKGRLQSAQTKRSEVYSKTITRLTELSIKLKNKGVDTTQFDADIAILQGKVTTFNTDLALYKQALVDLAAMDCVSDPDGFKASLETARSALTTVNKDATDIRTYLKDTIKPLLVTIRTELAANEKIEN